MMRKTCAEFPNGSTNTEAAPHKRPSNAPLAEKGRSGISGSNINQTLEFRLALGSNPEFTSSVLVAYARAVIRMRRMGDIGAKTAFDVAPGLLSPKSAADLRKELL